MCILTFLHRFNILLDNIIRENQWGGVDIRHGGDPVVTQNIICNGMSDGIVIGEKGRGSIENNIITGWSIWCELGEYFSNMVLL